MNGINVFLLRVLMALTLSVSCLCMPVAAQDKKEDKSKLTLSGFIKESLGKKDLLKVKIVVTDSLGNMVGDTLTTGGYFSWDSSTQSVSERSYYSFKVPRTNAVYNLEIMHPEYQTLYHSLTVDKIGRREFTRQMPNLFLQRAPRQLGEVTVTASKIKFYNRGDTLVYNADAFELAEGSMLDALVKQLPGVELREGGQIYVNGEYVESLLLNGKDFFNGNNELMLDNLAAYTVSNIEVYKKSSDLDKWAGVKGEQKLTMDIKLKKEYNAGWLINLEGGGGTSERYMGRAFINRFTNNSRLTFVGNVNNLNDNRKPGESSTWTPENNTAGTMRTQMGAFDYTAQHPEEAWKVSGNAMVRHTTQDDSRDVQRTNFLPGGDTYDYSFSRNKFKNLTLNTGHQFTAKKDGKYYLSLQANGNYNKTRSDANYDAASFDKEQQQMTVQDIADLFSGDPSKLNNLINRTHTRTFNSGHSGSASFSSYFNHTIPRTSDRFNIGVDGSYSDEKSEVWRDYTVNYSKNPTPAIRENQYFDNSPNRNVRFGANAGYTYAIDDDFNIGLDYRYSHADQKRDSYLYALDRLGEMGIIGTLPEGYLNTFDAAGSYRSHTVTNTHTARIDVNFHKNGWNIWMNPRIEYLDRNFSYFRNNTDYHIAKNYTSFIVSKYSSYVSKAFKKIKYAGRDTYMHWLSLEFTVAPTLPDPSKMVDITDDNDPMNIWVGNPSLKKSLNYGGEFSWRISVPVKSYMFSNNLELIYSNTRDALVNGYTYDTSTGVRTNRTYNVESGNYVAKIHISPSLQFGSKGQFTAFYRGGLDYNHYADMIGINATAPTQSSVYTYWQAHTLNFSWNLGKQTLRFMGQVNSRHTDSDRPDFKAITATHSNLMLQGQFKLPKGFGISTDFTVYMRRGYGSPELDTTDPVWNMRLTYTPPKSHWVIMLDGFDMLNQLSNVNYSVNAQGRTITYSNVLPRYAMLHVQYRINIQPKKQIIDNTRRDFRIVD